MKCTSLGFFSDVKIIQNKIYQDERGFFLEAFNERKVLGALSKNIDFVQDNHSRSKKGVLRGLHYQRNPNAQAKLIRVAKGAILDVVVDIRTHSKHFGKSQSIEINEKNAYMIFVPEGYAHGFLSLENDTDVIYKTNNFYCQESDGSLAWNDPSLEINWEFDKYKINAPIVSHKDQIAATLKELGSKKLLFP